MNRDLMREALAAEQNARAIKKKLDTFVLLKREAYERDREKICLGDPISFRTDEYHRVEVSLPEEARRWVFRLWRREQQLAYNALVRRIAQIGMQTDLQLIEVEASHR